jgi:DNA-binding IclR family transcriptional regulator
MQAISTDRLESLLSENGGLTTSELAEQTSANREQLLRLLRDLETAGRIRRNGQRRGTRWHAITDEDRIRQRTAELEASRKNRA